MKLDQRIGMMLTEQVTLERRSNQIDLLDFELWEG
jgi:hypothetical protein